ncbi:hypothetical protein Atai01_66700 [Amycolatopsis taiwanensis]|uniref:Uncharacterized protein n=1 Tax=Amycolatopsis taiwanensis TaxID=342230 RepID=A0A9W6R6P2_9PSEU|nr:hypothetical protein Atai01_66700 [Amycolatopsis taiwanensis]
MVWKGRITRWTNAASFNPPAATAALRDCERTLGQRLPRELAELLMESDGVETR